MLGVGWGGVGWGAGEVVINLLYSREASPILLMISDVTPNYTCKFVPRNGRLSSVNHQ